MSESFLSSLLRFPAPLLMLPGLMMLTTMNLLRCLLHQKNLLYLRLYLRWSLSPYLTSDYKSLSVIAVTIPVLPLSHRL